MCNTSAVDHERAADEGPLPPVNWWPMIFSIFIVFFPLTLLKRGNVTAFDWTLTALAVVSFVLLVAEGVASWQRRSSFLRVPVAMALVGFLLTPYGYAAELFFLFAALVFPWAVYGNIQRSVILAILLIYAECVAAYVQPVPALRKLWLVDVPLLTLANVATSLWVVRTTLSMRRLARSAVRERIAHDLSSVLGNALSLITLKAAQAARLLPTELHAAEAGECIAEVESISRRALADVRQAVRRYRAESSDHKTPGPIDWWPLMFAARLAIPLIAVEFLIGASNALLRPDVAERLSEMSWVTVPVFTAVSVAGCIWAVRMSLRHLGFAKAAERERLARDLHDVLGHTLSVIALKSELAGRLTERSNRDRALAELRDIEAISRQALADVKHTIVDDRFDTLETELERATSTLRTAGIAVQCRREAGHIDSPQEGILGLALREAVTNVVRHAEARTCSIRLHRTRDLYVLEVQDDGRGSTGREGQGLRGMRERIEALGGSVLREISVGTRLTVHLPVVSAAT